MVRVISWGFPAAPPEQDAEARAWVRLGLLMVSVISWPLVPPAIKPELPITWLRSWEPAESESARIGYSAHGRECPEVNFLSSGRNTPVASCSERPAIVTWAGVMVEGCRARLVSGWMTTLADTVGSLVDMSWLPEWETRPVSTLRGWERRPPCCNVCWRRAGSICKRTYDFRRKRKGDIEVEKARDTWKLKYEMPDSFQEFRWKYVI